MALGRSTHVRNPEEAACLQLCIGPALAIATFRGVNQQMEDPLCLSLSLSLYM